jgi:hypothetical protein
VNRDDLPEPPAQCQIVLQSAADGLRLLFPGAGLCSLGKQFGGWPVLLIVAIIAVTAPFTGHWEVSVGVAVILLLFGVATLRHTVVTVTDDQLTIVTCCFRKAAPAVATIGVSRDRGLARPSGRDRRLE